MRCGCTAPQGSGNSSAMEPLGRRRIQVKPSPRSSCSLTLLSQWLVAVNWLCGCSFSKYQSASRGSFASVSSAMRRMSRRSVEIEPAIFWRHAATAATRWADSGVTLTPADAAVIPKASMISGL